MNKPIRCALVGFANAGKSALYNRFLGKKQTVGNWSGITVGAASKQLTVNDVDLILTDLPGIANIEAPLGTTATLDEQLTHQFIEQQSIDCIVNVVDATQLHRQLDLTLQLREQDVPVIVVITKTDRKNAQAINPEKLSQALGCPVLVNNDIKKDQHQQDIRSQLVAKLKSIQQQPTLADRDLLVSTPERPLLHTERKVRRHAFIANLLKNCREDQSSSIGFANSFDKLALHPVLGIPVFLAAMYLLFMFAINVGGAFIEFFDLTAGALLVGWPVYWLNQANLHPIVIALVEGLGMGAQTVATFIPLLACMFIGLSILEQSGYLARAAFVVDGVMQKIGLPGKSFVPLIVGFGCNVPSVMATRVLDNERERITTAMMAPFMSCGARLPVYALFAAVFFPASGQNIVFILYLIGIFAAIMTGLLLKHTILPGNSSHSMFELPEYERPKLQHVYQRTYQRTKGFVFGAGKIIVILVCVLNLLSTIDYKGDLVEQDKGQSIIGVTAKALTPILAPMGVREENWQATVGLVTGLFAKEVLVATLDNLYTVQALKEGAPDHLVKAIIDAANTIPENLLGIDTHDPIGITIEQAATLTEAAQMQEVNESTYSRMQELFNGQLGAFSYLLFILLYTPCAAVLGAMKQEFGVQWAVFSAIWCLVLAYLVAVLCYQIGNIGITPSASMLWIGSILVTFLGIYFALRRFGKKIMSLPIAVTY